MSDKLSQSRALVVIERTTKMVKGELTSPYFNSRMSACRTLQKAIAHLQFHLDLIRPISEACLQGPRVLGRLAPTQEALDILILNASPFNRFAGWEIDYTQAYAHLFSPFSGPYDKEIKEACLRGPRVLGRLAPSQEVLNNFVHPYLAIWQKVDIEIYVDSSLDRDYFNWWVAESSNTSTDPFIDYMATFKDIHLIEPKLSNPRDYLLDGLMITPLEPSKKIPFQEERSIKEFLDQWYRYLNRQYVAIMMEQIDKPKPVLLLGWNDKYDG